MRSVDISFSKAEACVHCATDGDQFPPTNPTETVKNWGERALGEVAGKSRQ